MTDKERTSVTLDVKNHEYLKKQDNASAIVNDLVEQMRNGGDRHNAALQLQIEQKTREKEQAEKTVERLGREIAELKQLVAANEQHADAKLDEAIEALETTPRNPQNPAIENWAGKLGMTPTELIEELPPSNE